MGRRPNYDFERRQREIAKKQKKAERERVKQEKSDQRKGLLPEDAEDHTPEGEAPEGAISDSAGTSTER